MLIVKLDDALGPPPARRWWRADTWRREAGPVLNRVVRASAAPVRTDCWPWWWDPTSAFDSLTPVDAIANTCPQREFNEPNTWCL
ncbi:hypothetical protein JNW91_04010 [Micromonospora sp. STR1_7]|uniref:Uncharacterized protein n=1 Tax=Micromonospora parastrephiae TaxID=2806101 RepID=A0ABS1XPI9_9ACTN|nr:hypothetical protein [Micromonospora parastrephiae]MBM0231114.1 hypothetical protein [Micromonospora parastrephiae]